MQIIMTQYLGKMIRIAGLFLLCLTLITSLCFAQEKYTISGYIKEASTGEDLIGANIYIQELFKGTSTNQYGFYSITVPEGDYTLKASYLGFSDYSKKISLSKNLRVNIPLQNSAIVTEEIIIESEKPEENVKSGTMGTKGMDLQQIKSTLMRNLLDNSYLQNYGRYAVLEGQANLDDLLTARPGGVVRVKSPNAVMPLATPALEPYTFEMLSYIDNIREERAGVSKNTQGMNDKALTSHTTAAAVNAVMTAAQSRIELVARQFAETGVKDLMKRVYELLVKNQDRDRTVRIRNEWVPVDPSQWDSSMDAVVSVALGHGNKDQQVAQLNQIMQMAAQAKAQGDPMVTGENMFNIASALLKAMGYQNFEEYITPPQMQQQPPPKPEQQKAQADMQKIQAEIANLQADTQRDNAKVMLDAQKFEHDKAIELAELELKQAELQIELETGMNVKAG